MKIIISTSSIKSNDA